MNNEFFTEVPSSREQWQSSRNTIVLSARKISSLMEYYHTETLELNYEDLGPLRSNLENLMVSTCDVMEDVSQMIDKLERMTREEESKQLSIGYNSREWLDQELASFEKREAQN